MVGLSHRALNNLLVSDLVIPKRDFLKRRTHSNILKRNTRKIAGLTHNDGYHRIRFFYQVMLTGYCLGLLLVANVHHIHSSKNKREFNGLRYVVSGRNHNCIVYSSVVTSRPCIYTILLNLLCINAAI